MLKVALTGNIGSGKSTVVQVFIKFGIPVYMADDKAKELYRRKSVVEEIIKHFGVEICDANQNIVFKKLGSIVFSNKQELKWLNDFIHPLVKLDFEEWLKEHSKSPYIIQEAAILFESGFDKYFDKIITVSTPIQERINRVMLRDNIDSKLVVDRINNQMLDEEKEKKSDFVIRNGETDLIVPQILTIHNTLLEMASNHKN